MASVEQISTVLVPADVGATLRSLDLLDPDLERLVFAMRAHPDGDLITGPADDLDLLLDALAFEANHEPNRRRQRVLDAATDVLERALDAAGVMS